MVKARPEFYKQVKVAGMLLTVPFVLGAGPFSGFFLGEYLQKRFHLPPWVTPLTVVAGILAAAVQAWRIIKAAVRAGS